jgi:hypothetical protein
VTVFHCPGCRETYRPHWRAEDGTGTCRTCAAQRDGRCQFPDHPHHGHPCSWGSEAPGEPCRYCAAPVPADGSPCPVCWVNVSAIAHADLKAMLAAVGLELTLGPV